MASPDGTASKLTPVQSNSEENDTMYVQNIPSLDTDADQMLNVNETNNSLESEKINNSSGNGSWLRPSDKTGDDHDEDDMDDNVSRISDITEDRTQHQIDDFCFCTSTRPNLPLPR